MCTVGKGEESLPKHLPDVEICDEFSTVESAVSLPNNLPDEYTYMVIDDGQFRVKEIGTVESAKASFNTSMHVISVKNSLVQYCI